MALYFARNVIFRYLMASFISADLIMTAKFNLAFAGA